MHSSFFTPGNISRRAMLKWLGATGASLAVFSGGCQGPAPAARTEETGASAARTATAKVPGAAAPTTLRVSFASPPKTFDPARMATVEAYHVAFAIYDALVWIDRDLLPQPLVAESWETGPDLLSWTFALRRGIKFHHNADLTAQDVVYTFNRLRDPAFGSSLYTVLQGITSVAAVDAYTVRFQLVAPNAEFPFLLGSPQAGIVPDQASATDLAVRPVGAGPYRFVEALPGGNIRLQRFAGYWEVGDYSIENLEYHYFPSFAAQAEALLAGKVEIVTDVNLQDLERLVEHPEIELLEVPSGRYQTIVMQATEEPFKDVRVRQALKYCVDRPGLQTQVMRDYGEIACDHPVAPVNPFWADLALPEQDLDQARQLLADAGYPNGLDLELITSASRPGMLELADAFRTMAQPAGIRIRVTRVPADVYWSDYGGKVPFHVGNWNFRPSIDETLTLAHHSQSTQNESRWADPALDALIEEARSEGDFAVRLAHYREAQQLIRDKGAVVIPYFRPVIMALQRKVKGFSGHPSGWLDFHGVQIDGSA